VRFDIVTIFPGFFTGPLDYGIVRRAREAGIINIDVHDLRNFTHDRHRTVDDRPFGGGEGMVLKPEPIFEAVESLFDGKIEQRGGSTAIVLLSAGGKLFRQAEARRLSSLEQVVLLCGRYEGVDERVAQHLATDELSIGDFVLSGGELAAALVIDAVTRLLPGALGNEASVIEESFSVRYAVPAHATSGNPPERRDSSMTQSAEPVGWIEPLLLDYPHFTRPAEFRGWTVPDILISGNHEEIRRWRRQMALEKTRRNRPDLLIDSR